MSVDPATAPRPQCVERVYVRDTYRYTGGPRRFQMHYSRQQCSRTAQPDREYCWQHPWANPPYLKLKRL